MTLDDVQVKTTILSLLGNIAPEVDLSQLSDDADIRATLGIDSFDFLNFMIALSDSFGVEIPESDYGKLVSLKDILHYLHTQSA